MEQAELESYIPLDKSWMIRLGVMDILNGCPDIVDFLEGQTNLSDDLQSLQRAAIDWPNKQSIDVGESGTLYRFLQFASWKLELNKHFIKRGTLLDREITDDPLIVSLSASKRLKLDNGTSQWESAAVLLGSKERITDPPTKLQLTYEASDHWNEQRRQDKRWEPRLDATIRKQAQYFLKLLNDEQVTFKAEHSEDYCFARAFSLITREEGTQRWSSLAGHESNRPVEMEEALYAADKNEEVKSRDHRIVQAIGLRATAYSQVVSYAHEECVSKSWPSFWDFLDAVKVA